MTEKLSHRPGGRGGSLIVSSSGQRFGGRQKGQPNKTTRVLKEAILLAAEQVGEDGRGKDGLLGYLKRVARRDTKSFVSFWVACCPCRSTGMTKTRRK